MSDRFDKLAMEFGAVKEHDGFTESLAAEFRRIDAEARSTQTEGGVAFVDPIGLGTLRALEAAAAKGPWRAGSVEHEGKVWCPHPGGIAGPSGERCLLNMNLYFPHTADREFIAAARNEMPALLGRVEVLERALVEIVAATTRSVPKGQTVVAVHQIATVALGGRKR